MIVQEMFYGIKCDRCGEIHDDGEHSFWTDASTASENAMESDWIEIKNKDYCPNCYFLNEETDENELKEPIGEHIKSLKRFISKTLLAYLQVTEQDDKNCFLFYFKRFKEHDLKDYEKDFIVNFLQEKLISFTGEPDKYGSKEYKIQVEK